MEGLVHTLGFSEHQYIAVRHNDTNHEHIHVAVNKIPPRDVSDSFARWDHQKLFTGARALERELGLTPLRSRTRDRERSRASHRLRSPPGHPQLRALGRENLRPALRSRSYGLRMMCTTSAAVSVSWLVRMTMV